MDKQFKNRQFVSWCKRLIRVGLFSLYAAVALDTNSSIAAPTGKLEDWRFSPLGSQLEISLSAPSRPQYFYLSQPPRLVVDLPNTRLGYVPTEQNYNGAVQRIRVSQLNEDVTRIVLDLAPGAFFDSNQVQLQPLSQNPNRWVLRPFIARNDNFLPPGYSSVGGDLPPGAYSPQPPGILPLPQPPGNLPPGMYNPSQTIPSVNTQPVFATPLTLPPVNNGSNGYLQQPTVTVPPITNNNRFPQIQNPVLPPATFPSPSGNFSTPPSLFPAAPYNSPVINTPESGIIEFGQPFPNPNQ
ncbi:AMIN domain-containing protein [Plectonema cf. radiosum LEGE 06105]|uniref:AMIN domain-containing protein n=1 Tax=Plectonema cf. radiosum LEGE 06105 TaxID=945769 RepID=A0A8J7JZJ7_9CYAN|nr:AMIN domain-containing protein [Plectonema radiosum]MBE9212551.1 AMIN domain-containing protein [Plectonema cf. radiosum LEGE 06105]